MNFSNILPKCIVDIEKKNKSIYFDFKKETKDTYNYKFFIKKSRKENGEFYDNPEFNKTYDLDKEFKTRNRAQDALINFEKKLQNKKKIKTLNLFAIKRIELLKTFLKEFYPKISDYKKKKEIEKIRKKKDNLKKKLIYKKKLLKKKI